MRNKNKKSNGFLKGMLVLLLIGIIGGYIFIANNMTAKGFKVRELSSRVQALKEQNDKIKLQVAEAQAVSSVQDKISSINMVAVDKFDYVAAADTAMARK